MPYKLTFKVKGTRTEYSCGCVSDIADNMFSIVPCSPDCRVYKYVTAETERQKKKIHFLKTGEGLL